MYSVAYQSAQVSSFPAQGGNCSYKIALYGTIIHEYENTPTLMHFLHTVTDSNHVLQNLTLYLCTVHIPVRNVASTNQHTDGTENITSPALAGGNNKKLCHGIACVCKAIKYKEKYVPLLCCAVFLVLP